MKAPHIGYLQAMASLTGSSLVTELRHTFRTGKTRSEAWRQSQLEALKNLLDENQETIIDALVADLGKPRFEAFTTEVAFVRSEVEHALKHLHKWMKPTRVKSSLVVQPATSKIYYDPLGVALVIGTWNYPIQLSLGPVVGAIAAGNCVVIKPSEVAVHSSNAMAELVPRYMDPECVRVVEGGIPETTDLLAQKWDHIFYTGSGHVGRIVMTAAAKHLTPVTLELGGKSPAIIDRDADIQTAAKRLVWGKFTNAGQTCVAPDYLFVHEAVHDELLAAMSATITEFYGVDPSQSADYGRIINQRHWTRLRALIDSGTVAAGGDFNEAQRYIGPTLLTDVAVDSPVMAEEIFGPLLPLLKFSDMSEVIESVNDRPKPLALYIFTKSQNTAKRVLQQTSSGGGAINHCWINLAVPGLPFGGVGDSGMGAYHGRHGFETFSHRKGIVDKPTIIDPAVAYPPYTDFKMSVIKRLM